MRAERVLCIAFLSGLLGCGAGPSSVVGATPTQPSAARAMPAAEASSRDEVRAAPDRERSSIAEAVRPRVIESRAFDPLALPREARLEADTVRRDGWASLGAATNGYKVWLGRDLLAELEVPLEARAPFRAYAGAAVPSTHHRPLPETPPCDGARFPGRPVARWAGIDRRDWTESAVWFERYEGPFDRGPCRAKAWSGFRVRATALVPGVLYAFRSATSDSLVLVAPPAEWVSAAETPEELQAPHVGTLSLATLPMKRGRMSSALVVVGATGIDLFDAVRSSRVDTFATRAADYRGLALRTDVIWPAADEAPSALVVVSGVTHLPDVQLR